LTIAVRETAAAQPVKTTIVDCDIHNYLPSETTLRKYLSARWCRYLDHFGPRVFHGLYYPLASQHAARTDAWPPSGLIPGSDLSFMREQLLDRWGIEYGVLLPLLGAGKQLNLEWGAAMCAAANDWQVAEWLDPEPRLRASIVVPYEAPELAVEEIRRRADDRRFVQVEFESRTLEPLGRRKYWPIYEAASERGLPIGMHFGAQGGWPITGVGSPSFYVEYHTGQAQSFQDQVISLVTEGVFERFPKLKFVLIEGGFGWLPPLMWRLDRAYAKLKEEVPHLRRLPSEYVRDHFWLTTQPVEEPHDPADFALLLDDLGMDDRVMFSTDYPHWDFDAPDAAIPTSIGPERQQRIMSGNAHSLYRF
jgi:predicted TIM-barrel fold metal-dependent hydrolase